jgi:hypothetical protein
MAFVPFCSIVLLLYPVAVVLSVSICAGGCLCLNSYNVVLRTAPSLAFIQTAPISASAAEDIVSLLPLPQTPVRARTDARTNPSAQRATQLRSVLAHVNAVSIQNQITTTVP